MTPALSNPDATPAAVGARTGVPRPEPRRNGSLDCLRAIAVLLVLGRHTPRQLQDPGTVLVAPLAIWRRGGWVGVDLFFVLSGFLIAGLLFREYERFGAIDVKRFLVRRAFKIYPSFYLLYLTTVVVRWLLHEPTPRRALFNEALFLQNYGGATLWGHTWSLAVEEHFYLILPVVLFLLARGRRAAPNPFRRLPLAFAVVAAAALSCRILTSCRGADLMSNYYYTHTRIDSLMFGVVLSYFHQANRGFVEFCRRWGRVLQALGVGLLVPAFCGPLETAYQLTWGLSCCYLGGGAILVGTISRASPRGGAARCLAFVGSHSYCIYLWHAAVGRWVMPSLGPWPGGALSPYLRVGAYCGLSILAGIACSRVVEYPVLRLRDRFFPTRSLPMAVAPASSG
jgi:peptidoglycan/LPS O-acetylase OafA/YrhL